ncbi:carbohydrate ABC transporter permease [Anaerobium acetethylicum]|uniref:Multiple sugar transport system permease protein n=1 Tax=Anaerobium acetethylicum TaxID=1619234 RepID=A0A1D3TWV8_9FIRM|nr:sugar ABC transporter permease [Anaerobium acetethylicum]SCP98751.1 multiple sugar transport system permease protein [Anaerobium acetethylicum]
MSEVIMSAAQKQKKSLKDILRGKKGQQFLVITLFMIVPLTLLIVFTGIPFFKMVQFSFYKMKYIGPREFVGLQNYKDVFQRSDIFKSLIVSVYYMGGAVVQLGLALFFATLLVFGTKGSSLFKGAMFFPYLICGIAVGFIFKFFYARGFVLDSILNLFGTDFDDIPLWLQDKRINNISLAATSVWRYLGQNMILFLGAMMSVDTELYEAAQLDGANKWHQFRYIILPSIKSIVVLNLILSISGSLSAFEPPYVITNGTMGTGTYFVIMNRLAHENQKVGLACAMAIVLLAIIIVCTVAQKLFFKYMFDDGTADESKAAVKKRKQHEKINRKALREGESKV